MQGIEDAVLRNIQAVSELSDLVRTSFGPNGKPNIRDITCVLNVHRPE
jgi:chaperonin GroEL (HSP60 family)